jgi:3'-phosphoadenosine 5'-phosphosulfate sulfotransferase (PAPS reductase)/FAD synthetase
MIKVANFGVGVNSVAGLIKYGIENYDEVLFSDTGSEKPETYEYLKWLIEEKDWKITVIDDHYGVKLYDYYFKKKTYPTRFKRDCTTKFKIMGMKRYLRKKYGKKETFLVDLFIDYGEITRMRTSDVSYETLNYPLINDKIDRKGCEQIILDAGFPIPEKSGCFMCPFQNSKTWLKLKDNHPDLFKKAVELESNASNKHLIRLVNTKETLKDGGQSCLTGYCMN